MVNKLGLNFNLKTVRPGGARMGAVPVVHAVFWFFIKPWHLTSKIFVGRQALQLRQIDNPQPAKLELAARPFQPFLNECHASTPLHPEFLEFF